MEKIDYELLFQELKAALSTDIDAKFAVVGHTPLAYDITAFLRSVGAEDRLLGIYFEGPQSSPSILYHPIERLGPDSPDVVVIASDERKEYLLELVAPQLRPDVRIILTGYAHFNFRDDIFDEVVRTSAIPSLANGYPNSLVHLYQCLRNAARMKLNGVVVEFGIFKGGTTMLLSRFIECLGQSWPVIGFDTFAGFPPRRSVLDMYEHPDCVFRDELLVRQYLAGRNVEIIAGDVVRTVERLRDESILVAFIDTDNFTSASAVLNVVPERVVVGGAIVFDHYTGTNRFRYTLGERIAAKRLLRDARFFNLHGTGVFLRQYCGNYGSGVNS